MEKVTITVDSAVYEFYRKVGLSAGGLPPEQVMADALFKLAGELSLQALHKRAINIPRPSRGYFLDGRSPMLPATPHAALVRSDICMGLATSRP